MGIPAFYRWLVERYPRAVVEVEEELPTIVNGVTVPVDTSKPKPSAVEYDNLYLDMNGIIHPCFHPEGLPAPESYDEVFHAMFKYIDRIFSVIRPRKLLFLAIDGVAPRAKMNQQRARRFRAAKEVADEVSATERLQGVYESKPEELGEKMLDSNVITPGTEFMELLSSALRYYIHLRMNKDPGWQGIKVILSDASVPGEGEHKIVSYIRLQRNLPGFDPNTHHCLYGLDADLIMLALATHEIYFTILREDVRRAPEMDMMHGRQVQRGKNGNRQLKEEAGFVNVFDSFLASQKFQVLRIWLLREYLAHELRIPDPIVKIDLERLIDDFVFMCLFVGNDFLPHVPSLEIREGAIDLLMTVYKKEFVQMGGYLTNSSEVNLERVEHFIRAVGSHETAIFRKRNQIQKQWEIRSHLPSTEVKLGEEGWKERYYTEKFEVQTDDERDRIRNCAVSDYVEGICWVMHYYYQGICSWQWFYPYHYAPFASDFQGLDKLEISFTLGKPFKPFDQLMGVLPAASAQALPFFYRKLMTDPSSPILDFYPMDFEVDLNGKRQAWQGVCKLPFIDEGRLLAEIKKVEHTLTDEEKQRNSLGLDVLFLYKSHPLAPEICSFYKRNKDNPKLLKGKIKRKIDPELSGGMNGYIYISHKPVCPAEICSPIENMEVIMKNKVISVSYKVPFFHPHIPKLPEGVIVPRKRISKYDIHPPAILWHKETAAMKSRCSERPMPRKSVSGLCLAKLAHQLVSKTCAAEERKKKRKLNKQKKREVARNCATKEATNKAMKEATNEAMKEATNKAMQVATAEVSGPCLVKLAHQLVSETCAAKPPASENQFENGKRKREDAPDEKTKKKKKKKQRNKKRKMNEATNDKMSEAKNEATNEAKEVMNEATSEVSGPCLAKLAHELVSEIGVTLSTANENQCESGKGKREDAPEEKTKKKKKRKNKKRKTNVSTNEATTEATKEAATEPTKEAKNEAMTEVANKVLGPCLAKLAHELVSETGVVKSPVSENQCANGKRKREDAQDEKTKKKKRRNKKRKMNKATNDTMSKAKNEATNEAKEAAREATQPPVTEATEAATTEAKEEAGNEATSEVSGPCLAKLAHELVSEIGVTLCTANENQCESGKGKREDAPDEKTKKKKKKRQNKKRKTNVSMNEATTDATKEAATEPTKDAKDTAMTEVTNKVLGPCLAKLAHELVSETGEVKSPVSENQYANGKRHREDAPDEKTNKKKKRRNKKRKANKATNDTTNEVTNVAMNAATKEATNKGTNEVAKVAMNVPANEATDKARNEVTNVAMNFPTNESTNEATKEVTNVAMNIPTNDATNEATKEVANVAMNIPANEA